MKTRHLVALVSCLVLQVPNLSSADMPPNIVIILADDLGWKDVGYNGSEIRTPHIDALAASGARLDTYYAMPTCSPTRSALMTGQSPVRLGIFGPMSKNNPKGLPLDRKILPQFLKESGYQTALAGKWHLGPRTRAYLPNQRGFDSTYGNLSGGVGYWDHVHGGIYDWHRDGVTSRDRGYTTHLIAEEARRVIVTRDKSKPLFLYAAFNAPHLPNEAPEESVARYQNIENENRRIHAAMVSELDSAIGKIIQTLDHEGMTDDTLIWFMSDNGGLTSTSASDAFNSLGVMIQEFFGKPAPGHVLEFIRTNTMDGGSDNGPFRKGKTSVFEGGVRVPAIVSWKGKLPPSIVRDRVTVVDVLPTLMEAALGKEQYGQARDGDSRWGLITGDTGTPTPDYVTIARDGMALYSNQWKLIDDDDLGLLLYDLSVDPYEETDVATSHPELVQRLAAQLESSPRGEDIALPLWKVILDPDFFGGEEEGPSMADRVVD